MASEFPTCIRASVVVSVPEIENKGRLSGKIMNSVFSCVRFEVP